MTSNQERTIRRYRDWLRFPLWPLMLLVVLVSMLARHVSNQPALVYSENRSNVVREEDVFLDSGFLSEQLEQARRYRSSHFLISTATMS